MPAPKEETVKVEDTEVRYNFFCKKCGDDFYTTDARYYEMVRSIRWRCNTCVGAWL